MSDLLTIPDRVRAIIATSLCVPVEKLEDDANLMDDLGADSLDPIEFAMHLEDQLRVHLPDHVVERWRTVGDVIRSVEEQR